MARLSRYFLIALGMVLPLIAASQLSPPLQTGLDWLIGRVQSVFVLGEDQSRGTPLQVRSETIETLRSLASIPMPLADAVLAHGGVDADTESLARQVMTGAGTGRDVQVALLALEERQNIDGGFGGGLGYASHALDTSWAVLAYAQAGRGASAQVKRARDWLASRIVPQGEYAGSVEDASGTRSASLPLRLYTSAMVALALQTGGEASNAQASQQVTAWLAKQQGADGGWAGDTLITAWVLLAVAPSSSDSGLKSAASTFLQTRQAADGSWNGDPYITALALRALTARANTVGGAAGQSSIAGVVVDALSGLPVAGANVAAAATNSSGGNPAASLSDEQGRFVIKGLLAGTYAIAVSRSGYQNLSSSASLTGSQTADLGRLKIQPSTTTAILRGQVVAQASGQALANATVTLTLGGNSITVSTDSGGRYEFSTVPPGAFAIQAALTGYQPANGTGSVAAGQTMNFSPALLRVGDSGPTMGTLLGQVVNAAGSTPLVGVLVSIRNSDTGATVTTATTGDGRFSQVLGPGSYVAAYSLGGFVGAQQNVVLSAGATVNLGLIPLNAVRTTSLVRGIVTSDGGKPLAGATVAVVGTSPAVATLTAADGSYLLDNLTLAAPTLRASAQGYNSQSVTLSAPQPTEISFSFVLASQVASGLAIESLSLSPATVSAHSQLRGTASLVNSSPTTPVSASGSFDIVDARGQTIGSGVALSDQGEPLGSLELAPGQKLSVGLLWNSGRFEAGSYQLVFRLFEPGSASMTNPKGNILVERAAGFEISTGLRIAGSATASPPVLRAGTNTPVRLSALLQNDGNAPLPAGSYRVSVLNTQSQTVASSTEVSAPAAEPAALLPLDFGSWTPTTGGDFQVTVQAVDSSVQGAVSTPLYVGDSGSARFIADRTLVPTGNQSVRATINISGQDVAGGTISDPLAPMVKAAITKAVGFADNFAYNHYVNDLKCYACHVQTQALVGGESNLKYVAPKLPLQRSVLFSAMNMQMESSGALPHFATTPEKHRGVNTSLALWAAMSWRDKSTAMMSRVQMSRYLRSTQQASGGWNSDHISVWWRDSPPITALNLGSLAALHKSLSASDDPAPALPTLRALTVPGLPAGDLRIDAGADGTLYVANTTTQQLWRVSPSNQASKLDDIQQIVGVRVLTGGDLLVAARSGVYLRRATGGLTRLNSISSWDAVPYGSGFLVSPWGGSTIYSMTASGTLTAVFSSSQLGGSSSSLAPQSDGSVLVLSGLGRRLLRFSPSSGALIDIPVPTLMANTGHVLTVPGGQLIATDDGLYRYDINWVGERIHFERTSSMARMPDGRIVVSTRGGLYQLQDEVIDKAANLTALAASVDRATRALQTNAISIDDRNNIHLAFQLMGLGRAQAFYQGTPRAAELQSKMGSLAATLRSRQKADGGWSWTTTQTVSDSLVTAIVGVALDFLNPSPDSPEVRKAVQLLLSRQQADGTWRSENGITTVPLLATTWVEIWLPVMLDRLGGIDARLSLDLAANQTASGFSTPPTVLTTNAAGGQHLEWKLDGVTSAGRSIAFDLMLTGLAPGEQRPLATAANLVSENTFTGQPAILPIDIPSVRASAFLDLTVATDRPSYGADAPVLISVPVLNGGASLSNGQVLVSVVSPTGATLAQLGSFPTGDMAPGATRVIAALWNSGATASATGYQARATLLDAQGRTVNTVNATFNIVGQVATGVAARITADRPSYAPTDTVLLTERIDNLQSNTTLEGLVTRTTVRNAAAAMVWQRSEPLSQLSAGLYKQLTYSVALANATAGRYTASMEVLDSAGLVRANDSTTFDVGNTAGTAAGLGGTLVALPKTVHYGDAVALQWTISNQGNSAFSSLPVAVRILDPMVTGSTQAVIAELPTSVALAVGQNVSYIQSWTPSAAQVNKTVVAALVATVGGQTVTLAQDRVQVLEPPVRLDLATLLRREARVLALVSCPGGEDSEHEDDDLQTDQDPKSLISAPTSATTPGTTQNSSDGSDDDDDDDHGQHAADCSFSKAQAMRGALTRLGLAHKVVTSRAEFETELRCGQYNTYWISGGSAKLSDSLARQLREAVRRGDSLLMDAAQDGRNRLLHPALGVRQMGTLSQKNLGLQFVADGLFPAGSLATQGRPARFQLQGGIAQAMFAAGGSHDSLVATDTSSSQAPAPAIVSNVFGQGRTLLFAFDLAAMLVDQGSSAAEQDLLQRSLGHLAAGTAQPANVGEPVAVGVDVRNTSQRTASVKVSLQLPAEARFMSASDGVQADAQGRITWTAQLAPGEVLPVTLRLNFSSAGAKTLNFTVQGGLRPDAWVFQQTAAASLQVQPNSAPVLAALQQLQALAPTGSAERAARSAAVSAATQAQTLMNQQNFAQALPKWIAAAEALQDIRSLSTQAAALSLAQALQAAQRALCPQLACLSGRLTYSVAGQGTRLIPLGSTPLQVRSVANQCPAPFNGLGLVSGIVNQDSGKSLLSLNQTLNLASGQSQQRQDSWKAQDGKAGETLQATLVATWQGLLQSLDVQDLQLVVVQPKVAGTVAANPATVKRGSAVTINRTLVNQGVAAQSIRYTVKLINLSKGNQLEQQWADTLTLQPAQSSSLNWNYVPKASGGESLRLELFVTINGTTQQLATAALKVTP